MYANVIRIMKKQLESCKPMHPEKFYGEWFTPHGVVIISGSEGISGSPEAIAWVEKELEPKNEDSI